MEDYEQISGYELSDLQKALRDITGEPPLEE